MSFKISEEEVQETLKPFVEVFGGADGGVSYMKLRALLETSKNPLIIDVLCDFQKIGKLLNKIVDY